MSSWTAGEATSHFSRIPLIMTLKRLTKGRGSARVYYFRLVLTNFVSVLAGAYFLDALFNAIGIDWTGIFPPPYSLVGSYLMGLAALATTVLTGGRNLGRLARIVTRAVVIVLFVGSALLVLDYSSAFFRVFPYLTGPLLSSPTPLGSATLEGVVLWAAALVGVILELGAIDVHDAGFSQLSARRVFRRGLGRFALGLPTLTVGLVSLALVPLWLRWTKITVSDTPMSPEQLNTILSKLKLPVSFEIEHDAELERELTGYYFTVNFRPPLLFVNIVGTKTIIVYFKVPIHFRSQGSLDTAYASLDDQVVKFDQANFACVIDMKFAVGRINGSSAQLHVEEVRQTSHEGSNFYDHSYTETLMPRATNIELKDFFYKRSPLSEGSSEVPVLKVQARRDACGLESSTFVTSYDAEIQVVSEEHAQTVEIPFEMLMPYKRIKLNLEIASSQGYTIQSTEPKSSWSGPNQVMFNFGNLKPAAKIRVKVWLQPANNADRVEAPDTSFKS